MRRDSRRNSTRFDSDFRPRRIFEERYLARAPSLFRRYRAAAPRGPAIGAGGAEDAGRGAPANVSSGVDRLTSADVPGEPRGSESESEPAGLCRGPRAPCADRRDGGRDSRARKRRPPAAAAARVRPRGSHVRARIDDRTAHRPRHSSAPANLDAAAARGTVEDGVIRREDRCTGTYARVYWRHGSGTRPLRSGRRRATWRALQIGARRTDVPARPVFPPTSFRLSLSSFTLLKNPSFLFPFLLVSRRFASSAEDVMALLRRALFA